MLKKNSKKIQSVVLAGGINTIILYEGYKPGYKALLEFKGKPSILYTIEALINSKYVKPTVGVVGSRKDIESLIKPFNYEFIQEGDTILSSIFNALHHFKGEDTILIANVDIPLIKSEAIDEFLEECFKIDASYKENLFISVVPKEKFSGEFNELKKATNRFRDIEVCHGNLFLVNPRLVDNKDAVDRINNIYNSRKSPIKSALATGLGVGISYVVGVHMLHILTMNQMARIASKRFGIGFIPVVCSFPGIAIDADEPSDYNLICNILSEK